MNRVLLIPLIILTLCAAGCSDKGSNPSTDVGLTGVAPASGSAGTLLTLTGANFGDDRRAVEVAIGGILAAIETISATVMTVRVPAEVAIGATTIVVVRAGKSATLAFTVVDPIVGTWKAEGLDVSPLYYGTPFNIRRIVATFSSNGGYTIVRTDSAGASTVVSGTYVCLEGGAPAPHGGIRTITTSQASPSVLTGEGIYEVTVGNPGVTMKYETVQTVPPLTGVTKPTASGGFGSSSGGAFGLMLVQKFTRQ